jgi:TPR repeat protein
MKYEDCQDDHRDGHIKYILGCIYFYGDSNIVIDREKAFALFSSAAMLGHEDAQEYIQKIERHRKLTEYGNGT